MADPDEFSGRTALITGGTRGIGYLVDDGGNDDYLAIENPIISDWAGEGTNWSGSQGFGFGTRLLPSGPYLSGGLGALFDLGGSSLNGFTKDGLYTAIELVAVGVCAARVRRRGGAEPGRMLPLAPEQSLVTIKWLVHRDAKEGRDYDLAGFCVGVVEKDAIIDGARTRAGDAIIGLASSGPHSNGYALIRKGRALDRSNGGATPAVALTAYGRVEDRLRTISAGYSMHVPKPVDPGELTAIIASVAGRGFPTGAG